MNAFRNIAAVAIAGAFALGAVPLRAQESHDHGHNASLASKASTGQGEAAPSDHVAPPPPEQPMGPMSGDAMIAAMGMDDDATFAKLKVDRLERAFGGDAPALSWAVDAWLGRDFDKLRVRSEGERVRGSTEDADIEALWSHAIAPFWDTEVGVRQEIGGHAHRTWAAFGIQGLAPYWFELGATAYVGDSGRSALRIEADYDLSLTQRLILQPRAEVNAYGTDDRAAGVGAGMSDAEVGIRLRYEIRRELAPYVGVEWSRRFGETAAFARDQGIDASETRWVVGIRLWY